MPTGVFTRKSETKEKISKSMKGNKHSKGIKRTEEFKEKVSRFWKGRKRTPDNCRKISEWHINNPNRKFKDTKIELKVEAELLKRGIYFSKQVPLCNVAIVDFYLPDLRLVIQCDGDYWHRLEGKQERDKGQDKVLVSNGFKVYRFWESEINKSVKECINRINEAE